MHKHMAWSLTFALALAGVGGTVYAYMHELPESPPRAYAFLGAHALRGPMALPVVPVNVTLDGTLRGDTTIPGTEHRTLTPFTTCADDMSFPVPHEGGLGDGLLRYMTPPFHVRVDPNASVGGRPDPISVWYDDLVGEAVTTDDFPHGAFAWVTWGEAQSQREHPWPILLLRLNETAASWDVTDDGFVAFSGRAPYTTSCFHVMWTGIEDLEWGPGVNATERFGGHVLWSDPGNGVWDPRAITLDIGSEHPFEIWKRDIPD